MHVNKFINGVHRILICQIKFYVEEKRTRDLGKIYLFCCPSLFTEWEGSFWALWRFFLSKWTITQDTHKSTNLKQEIGDGTWVLYEIGLIITIKKGWTDI